MTRLPDLSGLLPIDKPAGMTSHDVVSRVRRIVGMKRVGHAGTLDPFATGVLIVAVGRATRVLPYLQHGDKQYVAHVVFGAQSDTADVDGTATPHDGIDDWPALEAVQAAVAAWVGDVDQRAPAYSAISVGGVRLYKLAREGIEVEAPVRRVRIDAIEVVAYAPPDLWLRVESGSGVYIRSLASDLGADLGVSAYCHALTRTHVGPFSQADCWTLDELAAQDVRDLWPSIGLHPDAALGHLPAAVLGEVDCRAWYHGQTIDLSAGAHATGVLRVYGSAGDFLGVGKLTDAGALAPSLVLPAVDWDTEESAVSDATVQAAEPTRQVVTIGNFDGVHRGHASLLAAVVAEARQRNLPSVALTFEPHPLRVLRPASAPLRLTTPDERERLLHAHGINHVQVLAFDADLAHLSADAFLDRLVADVRPAAILVGEGFRFGHQRQGDTSTMQAHGEQHGYDTIVVPLLGDGTERRSSSAVRSAVLRGDVATAATILGRRFRVTGQVEHGEARGRDLGFPTANLAIPSEMCVPGDGIYAAFARVVGIDRALSAMVYIGSRPTFDGGERIVEVNILDFSGDIYTRTLEIEFVAWIRGDRAFASAEALIERMQQDDTDTRAVLAATAPEGTHDSGAVY